MEVEQAILKSGLVSDVVVTPVEDQNRQTVLAAYLQELGGSISGMRDALSEKLPSYMIPALMIPIDRIPLTSNGKKDRKRLPKPDFLALTDVNVPATQSCSSIVKTAWSQVLGVADVPEDRNFFDIGGDSLKIVELYRLLSNSWPDKLKLTDLFQHATVARQSSLLSLLAAKTGH
ncbi:phosphopantetheine-binding protein [Yoonia sp. GPGPB17]